MGTSENHQTKATEHQTVNRYQNSGPVPRTYPGPPGAPSPVLGASDSATHGATHSATVTLLQALRPDIGGWVTLSPRY